MTPLYLDTETYCDLNLKTVGTYRYAEHAEIIMWQYAIGDGDVHVLDGSQGSAAIMANLLANPEYEIVIHNSSFDRTVIRYATGIDIPTERIFDTMACALAHSLPGSLEALGEVFRLSQDKTKDKEGKSYIQLFCVPQKISKSRPLARATKETHPEQWAGFEHYGVLDVIAMREIYKKLPKWNFGTAEREIWGLDQEMNDRGVYVDMEMATAAISTCADAVEKYREETVEMTGGAVTSVSRRDQLLEYILEEHGVAYKDLRSSRMKSEVENIDLPSELRDLLMIRLQATKTSTSKYKRVINCANSDNRLRGLHVYCGASRSGRWSGRVFQPQNLVRGKFKHKDLEEFIASLKAGTASLLYENVIEKCAWATRSVLKAAPGNKLVISDLSNIEGRVLAWLAQEEWKVEAFRDFDKGLGEDLYKVAYGKAFQVAPETVDDDQRQVGKVMELAFGYAGGVGAWLTFAMAYGIDLEDLGQKAISTIPSETAKQAEEFLKWQLSLGRTTPLSDTAFIVCDSFKRLWREAHPNVASYWKDLENSCFKAINNPGEIVPCRRHKIQFKNNWLRITLPSGRSLSYPRARIIDGKIAYWGKNQFTQKWEMIFTYGGKLAENITQAVARDVLAYAMPGAKKAGYDIVLSVHDELVTEVPDSTEYTAIILSDIMAKPHKWALYLPLAAKGFEAYAYRK